MKRRRLNASDIADLSRPPVKRAVRHKTAQGQRAARRPPSPSENQECRTFIAWTKLVTFDGAPLFERVVKIANERGKHSALTAILVSIGMRTGFPDYVLHVPVVWALDAGSPSMALPKIDMCSRFGLYLEAKRVSDGRIDPEQLAWRDRLVAWGYHAEICEGAAQMIDAVKRYMASTGATRAGRFRDATRVAA